jgi:hypothetical protein
MSDPLGLKGILALTQLLLDHKDRKEVSAQKAIQVRQVRLALIQPFLDQRGLRGRRGTQAHKVFKA